MSVWALGQVSFIFSLILRVTEDVDVEEL